MKVAVTGASGHLGGAIVRELSLRNFSIRALVRHEMPDLFEGIPLEFVLGDLANKQALNELMKSCDFLIHSAAHISIHGDPEGLVRKTNVEGVRSVMDAAKAAGIKRVIHISSIHAYTQKPVAELLDEHRKKVSHAAFAYDVSKKEGEEIALSFVSETMEVLVMNPTSIIGPYDYKPSKMGKVIIDLLRGKLHFVFSSGFDFCDVRDVASAIVNSLSMGRSGESYLLSGQWHSLKKIVALLSGHSVRKTKVIVIPLSLGWAGLPFIYFMGRIKKEEPRYTNEALVALTDGNRNISSAKAEKELNFRARPLKETLLDTYEWFLKNGYLG